MKKFVAAVAIFIVAMITPIIICEMNHDELVVDIISFEEMKKSE